MINQSSVLIAEPIAKEIVDSGKSFVANTGNIVKGLCEASYGALPYEPTKLPITLPEVTGSTEEHGVLSEQLSDSLAKIVQLSFTQIKTYLKPMAKELIKAIYTGTGYDHNAANIIFNNVHINYRKLDLAFFNSPFYPSDDLNAGINFREIDAASLRFPGKLAEVDTKAVYDMVTVDNPDIKAVIDAYCPGTAFNQFIVLQRWNDYFNSNSVGYDFTSLKDVCPLPLFSLYVVFSRLSASEDPIDGATNVTIEEYRAWVRYILNCLSAALVHIRRQYTVFGKMNFPFIKREVSVQSGVVKGAKVLRGNVTVGVTDPSIISFDQVEGETSISEAILGKVLAESDIFGNQIDAPKGTSIIDNKTVYGGFYNRYLEGLKTALGEGLKDALTVEIDAVLTRFQKDHDEFKETILKLDSGIEYARLMNAMRPDTSVFVNSFIEACIKNSVKPEDFVMGSSFIVNFGKRIGLGMAAEILANASVKNTDNLDEVKQRENLTEAVAKVLVQFVIKQ